MKTHVLFAAALLTSTFLTSPMARAESRAIDSLRFGALSAERVTTLNMPSVSDSAPPPVTAPTSCHALVKRLLELHEKLATLETSVVSTTNSTASAMSSWFGQLSANYGATVYIPYGVYDVISQSSVTSTQNAQVFADDFTGLLSELNHDIELLTSCTVTAPQS